METMKPTSKRWHEFSETLQDRMSGPLSEDGDVEEILTDHGILCDHNYLQTTTILEAIGDLDIPASIEWFELWAGDCDCEIVMNVIWRFDGLAEDETITAELSTDEVDKLMSLAAENIMDPRGQVLNSLVAYGLGRYQELLRNGS